MGRNRGFVEFARSASRLWIAKLSQKKSGIDWESFFIIKLSWKLYCVCMLKVQVKTAFYCIKPVNF